MNNLIDGMRIGSIVIASISGLAFLDYVGQKVSDDIKRSKNYNFKGMVIKKEIMDSGDLELKLYDDTRENNTMKNFIIETVCPYEEDSPSKLSAKKMNQLYKLIKWGSDLHVQFYKHDSNNLVKKIISQNHTKYTHF